MSVQSVDTIIIGAGVSGLPTAAALGKQHDLVVLERDAEIGGYCKTVKQAGFVWDYSGHFFHFKHKDIEQWLIARMPGQRIRTVEKKSFVSFAGKQIDFPFQKNIHQLPQADFIDCLHDLYFAQLPGQAQATHANFKEMLVGRFGRGIAERFLIPYNEKLYATDLATLDTNAMGRFFPNADLTDIVRNMKQANNASYNSTFTYPEGGAIEYVKAIASEVRPEAIRLGEAVAKIDVAGRTATTTKGNTFTYRHLVSSAPFPALLKLTGRPVADDDYTWNRVLVFNLGFDRKGPKDVHWVYYPDRARSFYRVGFYDNIFDADRMSLYVELGYARGASVDVEGARARVLADLRAEGLVTDHRLVAEHSVVMDPAYVHVTRASRAAHARLSAELRAHGVHSIGRYGGWTYCSIEDNIVEARALASELSASS